jgi:hypothetical protein
MINLNKRWAITLNELSVDVYERRYKKDSGEEYTTPKYYYPNLELALCGIVDRSLIADITELQAVVDIINDLKTEIRDFLQENCSVTGDSRGDLEGGQA